MTWLYFKFCKAELVLLASEEVGESDGSAVRSAQKGKRPQPGVAVKETNKLLEGINFLRLSKHATQQFSPLIVPYKVAAEEVFQETHGADSRQHRSLLNM